ncbi:hypothetical protein V8E55_005780, partial [Tylopilus felleus]
MLQWQYMLFIIQIFQCPTMDAQQWWCVCRKFCKGHRTRLKSRRTCLTGLHPSFLPPPVVYADLVQMQMTRKGTQM